MAAYTANAVRCSTGFVTSVMLAGDKFQHCGQGFRKVEESDVGVDWCKFSWLNLANSTSA